MVIRFMLVVLALAAACGPADTPNTTPPSPVPAEDENRARQREAATRILALADKVNIFAIEWLRLPETLAEAAGRGVEGQGVDLLDPWGEAYRYRIKDRRDYDIISLGADRLEGGDGVLADIDLVAARRLGGRAVQEKR